MKWNIGGVKNGFRTAALHACEISSAPTLLSVQHIMYELDIFPVSCAPPERPQLRCPTRPFAFKQRRPKSSIGTRGPTRRLQTKASCSFYLILPFRHILTAGRVDIIPPALPVFLIHLDLAEYFFTQVVGWLTSGSFQPVEYATVCLFKETV